MKLSSSIEMISQYVLKRLLHFFEKATLFRLFTFELSTLTSITMERGQQRRTSHDINDTYTSGHDDSNNILEGTLLLDSTLEKPPVRQSYWRENLINADNIRGLSRQWVHWLVHICFTLLLITISFRSFEHRGLKEMQKSYIRPAEGIKFDLYLSYWKACITIL